MSRSVHSPHTPCSSKVRGFTIVELLIVIVVIAILASITIVAYNGVQQRANNAAIIDAASKSIRMIQSYIAANGTPPATGGGCITTTSGCDAGSAYAANTTFDTNIATMGTVPRSIPTSGSNHYGIIYWYNASRIVDGVLRPVAVIYWLPNVGQTCGLSNLLADPNATTTTITSAAYTTANDSGSGKTLCAVSVPST